MGTFIENKMGHKTSYQHDYTYDRQHSDFCTLTNKAKNHSDSKQAPNNDSYFCRIHLLHIVYPTSRFVALSTSLASHYTPGSMKAQGRDNARPSFTGCAQWE